MDNLTNAVRQRIINLAKNKGITIHRLATYSGISYSTMNSFINGKCSSITMTTLLHICEGSEIGLKDFFDDPLFKPFNKKHKKKVSEHVKKTL